MLASLSNNRRKIFSIAFLYRNYGYPVRALALDIHLINTPISHLSIYHSSWMKELFRRADKDGDEVLSLKEVQKLLKTLNIDVDMTTASEIIKVGHTQNH